MHFSIDFIEWPNFCERDKNMHILFEVTKKSWSVTKWMPAVREPIRNINEKKYERTIESVSSQRIVGNHEYKRSAKNRLRIFCLRTNGQHCIFHLPFTALLRCFVYDGHIDDDGDEMRDGDTANEWKKKTYKYTCIPFPCVCTIANATTRRIPKYTTASPVPWSDMMLGKKLLIYKITKKLHVAIFERDRN